VLSAAFAASLLSLNSRADQKATFAWKHHPRRLQRQAQSALSSATALRLGVMGESAVTRFSYFRLYLSTVLLILSSFFSSIIFMLFVSYARVFDLFVFLYHTRLL
jgi:hypothetical protein